VSQTNTPGAAALEVPDEARAVVDLPDREVADEDHVGLVTPGIAGGEDVAPDCLQAGMLACAAEGFGVVIDGDGAAGRDPGDPLAGDGGGAAEVFGEDPGVAPVDRTEEADDVFRGLDAEFVQIKATARRRGRAPARVGAGAIAGGGQHGGSTLSRRGLWYARLRRRISSASASGHGIRPS
jgi:hypothetical protein